MPTDIAPSLGQGLVLLQAGPGAASGYSAIDIRRAMGVGLQEGVIDDGSFMVTQRGAGANMSVDIAASTGEGAYVKGDTVSAQGLYYVAPHSAVINEVIAANSSGNARVDQIILEALDDTHDAGGLNKARIRVLTGSTSVAGATLDNRTGATALPNNAVRLADVLVASGAVSVSNTNIRDRRPFARGAFARVVRTANASAGNDYSITATVATLVDAANLNPRIECSGSPIKVTLTGLWQPNATTGVPHWLQVFVDGAAVDGWTATAGPYTAHATGGGQWTPLAMEYPTVPAAGSHRIGIAAGVSSSSGVLAARSIFPLTMTVEEVVRQNAVNNSVTSG